MNTDDRALADLIAELRAAAKPGHGAALDWSPEECATYWARVAEKCRKTLLSAADRLEAFHAKPVVDAREVTQADYNNAAIPALDATPAERALYDERYKADHQAERKHFSTAITLAQVAEHIVAASVEDAPAPPVVEAGRREALVRVIADYQHRRGLTWEEACEDANGIADAILALTPVAAQGDEVRDLWSLEQRLTDGEFFSDYDEDLRLLGVFRRHVSTLKDSSHEG